MKRMKVKYRRENFSLRWKLAENYAAALGSIVFMWFFVKGIIESNPLYMIIAVGIAAAAPGLIVYFDKKSVRA